MIYKKEIKIFLIKIGFVLLFYYIYLYLTPSVYANEFKIDYQVDYYLSDSKLDNGTEVTFKVKITNLTIDSYIKKFSLYFPKSFQIGNIKAQDDFKTIEPILSTIDNKQVITAEFSNPITGLNEQNTLYFTFLQYNLFKINGKVWEVILPTVDRTETPGDYQIILHLPPGAEKQISISKPVPTHITLNEVIWNNPVNKTVYAVFGDQQNYNLELRYFLENPNLNRVYTDIAFPPDTLYQKVYVTSINPAPNKVFSDEDGNYMGRYYLNSKEAKTIYFKGGISLFTKPRTDIQKSIYAQFLYQKKYLLSETNYWNLQTPILKDNSKSIFSLYQFTLDTLSYNYKRINSQINRLGSTLALQNPDQAVCTEYSDVFISLLRENGFYAREMQGYGFSYDPELRPLSINSDILQSWPEYYDLKEKKWIPVDPTWEDTSGIDYYNSFDLNHIVFVIHGKKSDYPYPAGSYKRNAEEKDINIKVVDDEFVDISKMNFSISDIQMPGKTKNTFSIKVAIQNRGNTTVRDYPLTLELSGVQVVNPTQTILHLLPYETTELIYEYYTPAQFFNTKTNLILKLNENVVYKNKITLVSTYLKTIIYMGGLIALIVIVYTSFKLNKK